MSKEQKRDPLKLDSETRLYEKLSMTKDDLNLLNYIRQHVIKIIKREQTDINKSPNS